jgi:intraflagellar transport protein 46
MAASQSMSMGLTPGKRFGAASGAGGGGGGGRGGGLADRGDSPPHVMEESGGQGEYASDVEIPGVGAPGRSNSASGSSGSASASEEVGRLASSDPVPRSGAGRGRDDTRVRGSMGGGGGTDSDTESSSGSSDEGEGSGSVSHSKSDTPEGYKAGDYAHLAVPDEVKQLFGYITRYKPHTIALDTTLKPFIPDYIPAMGDIDAFIKPERPDSKEEELGLKQLDEPSPHQSDATVLDLQLRSLSKKSNLEPTLVRSIGHADKNPREITKWITSIQKLHRNKPPPSVHYAKSMPEEDALMQEWPSAFESALASLPLPGADVDMSLAEYSRVICALLDIPVYARRGGAGGGAVGAGAGGGEDSSVVQSLHVLFTLYNNFQTNQYFQQRGGAGAGAGAGAGVEGVGGGGMGIGMGIGLGSAAAGPGGANFMTIGEESEGGGKSSL